MASRFWFWLRVCRLLLLTPLLCLVLAYESTVVLVSGRSPFEANRVIAQHLWKALRTCGLIYPGTLLFLRWVGNYVLTTCLATVQRIETESRFLRLVLGLARATVVLARLGFIICLSLLGLPMIAVFAATLACGLFLVFTKLLVDSTVPDLLLSWNQFAYKSLDQRKSHIRVLKLYPGQYKDAVRCEFVTGAAQDLCYEALSYTWEMDIVLRRFIRLHGRIFMIPDNVYRAVCHLRCPQKARFLWIDFLCINQADKLERGRQVMLMRDIYRHAQRVVIWLGRAPKGTNCAFQKCGQVASAVSSEDKYTLLSENGRWQAALETLVRRKWWTRIWVLQEVVCARNAVVRTDGWECDWGALTRTITANQQSTRRPLDVRIDVCEFIKAIDDLKKSTHDVEGAHLQLAQTFRHRQATDGRDKLFALIGLLKDPTSAFVMPDYTENEHVVYARFTRTCIERWHHLGVFALSEQSRESGQQPSWVVDWSTDQYTRYRLPLWTGDLLPCHLALTTYRAHGGLPAETQSDPSYPGSIFVKGVSLSTVMTVGSKCADEFMAPEEEWNLALAIRSWDETFSATYDDPVFFRRSFDCTLMCDQQADSGAHWQKWLPDSQLLDSVFQGMGQSNELWTERRNTDYNESYESHPPPPPPSEKLDPAGYKDYRVKLCCRRRRMYLTEHGHLGLGPNDVRPGDLVAWIFGSAVPLILRSQRSFFEGNRLTDWINTVKPSEEAGSKFLLVGQTYLHGFMNWDGDIESTRIFGENIQTRWFHLV